MIARLLALMAAGLLAACGAPASDWPPPSPALWEITAPTGETAYLFGTVHALPDDVDWRTTRLNEALAQAGVLVVEIANPGDASSQGLFVRLSRSPGQPPLMDRVPAADRDELAALLEKANADAQQFAQVETWGAALMLASAASAGDPANGVDRTLLAEAGEVIALESVAGQFALFDRLDVPAQSALLAATAHEAAGDPEAGLRAWLAGDIAALEAMTDKGLLSDPTLREVLLLARNRAWLPRIEALIRDGKRPFVAVGAAHLVGADGLAAMLAAHGYKVERLQ